MAALPKTVVKLGWVSFFADVASEMVYPLISIFMVSILGAPASVLGLVEGAAESVVSFMKGWSGVASDRRRARLPYVRAGYGLSALGKPMLALAVAWPIALLARVTDRVGKGLRTTARDALIADAVTKDQRGAAFGFHRAMDTAGALVGVLVCALLIWSLGVNLTATQFAVIFALAGIPGLISVVITFRVQESAATTVQEKPYRLREVLRKLPRSFWVMAVVFTLFAFANSSDSFLLLYGKESGLTLLQVTGAYALYNVSYMLTSYPAGVWSDRVGRTPVILTGWILYAAVYAALGFQLLPLGVLLFGYGIYMGLAKGTATALVADRAPAHARGTAMGVFYLLMGAGTLLGNLAAGLVWDRYGSRTMLKASAAVALVSALALWVFSKPTGGRQTAAPQT